MFLVDHRGLFFLTVLMSSQVACLDRILEAPLILTTGFGHITGLAPTPNDSLLVSSDSGLWEVEADGTRRRLMTRTVRDVSTHPERMIIVENDSVSWGAYPTNNQVLELAGRVTIPGVTRVQAWFDGGAWVCRDRQIIGIDFGTGETSELYDLDGTIIDISLGNHQGTPSALILTDDGLMRVDGTRVEPIDTPPSLQSAVLDREERLWLLSEESPRLTLRQAETRTVISDLIPPLTTMTMGSGGLIPEDALFMATVDGEVQYIRAPFR